MVDLTDAQRGVLVATGHQLVIGGPGSGKTTVSILRAAQIVRGPLLPGQRVLFLSFARATVSRVLEAIQEEREITPKEQHQIEVDTYHSFFWRILKTHGYLVGLPRRIDILTPANEAIALSVLRGTFKRKSKLTNIEKEAKEASEQAELERLAREEGRVCFGLFAKKVALLMEGSQKIRSLISAMHPFVILDEFQDTSGEQWNVVRALGQTSTLIALADPEQRIFDFIGADPARLQRFRDQFHPSIHDLADVNHRSAGSEIAMFGNDILTGRFRQNQYRGVNFATFESNAPQAFGVMTTTVLAARRRLLDSGKRDWSLAVLVPTKVMTRYVSDALRAPFGNIPPISHSASVDMEGPILAAEIVAFALQRHPGDGLNKLVDLLCGYFNGKGGADPTQGDLGEATRLRSAMAKWSACIAAGKAPPGNSVLINTHSVMQEFLTLKLTGDPDADWRTVRATMEAGSCTRLQGVAEIARNIRLLERGTQLRQGLTQSWRDTGRYSDALAITRQSFVQEHFATAHRPETGVVVMNMHKAKGKQFDEVIIFEGWPRRKKGVIVANLHRILWNNEIKEPMTSARQNFRVSVTRARTQTTILTPRDDVCALLHRI